MHWTDISDRPAGDLVVVEVRGFMTLSDYESSLFKYIARVVEEGHARIVLNLRHVSYIDSVGIGEIVRCYMHVTSRGGALRLCEVGDRVREVLHATQLDTVLHLADTEEDALRSL